MNDKFFSIVIPTRDRLQLLKLAVESILKQNFSDFEIVIADNSSNSAVEDWITIRSDSRIRYFPWGGNLDVTENWNRAIGLAEGRYILMLGDDDVIVPNALSSLHKTLLVQGKVDCAYLGCYLFAMPNTYPGQSLGFLRSYENRAIYKGQKNPFFLDEETKKVLVQQSFNFIISFDYNPQFWLINRKFLKEKFSRINYYAGPYPDYFAAIATMMLAERVLVIPEEIVAIGITKMSHGFFHFTGDDQGVTNFQNFRDKDPIFDAVKNKLIPVTLMPTLWAVTLEHLSRTFGIRVNWARYRKLQIIELKALTFERRRISPSVLETLSLSQKLSLLYLRLCVSIRKKKDFSQKSSALRSQIDTHPIFSMPNIAPSSNLYLIISSLFGIR